MYNPDYPTDNTPGFLAHTYQGVSQPDMFYWNGQAGMFGGSYGSYDANSRRNINPVNPFTQFGQQKPAAQMIPESAVQPFSSYPPATPQQSYGLNSIVESRRNMPAPTVQQNNPWAQTPAPQMAAPVVPDQTNSYIPQNAYFDPGYMPAKIDMNTAALYGGGYQMSYDKHNAWDNYYTQARTLPMPSIDWHGAPNCQQCGMNMYNAPKAPQYPTNQFKPANMNWADIAKTNWSEANL